MWQVALNSIEYIESMEVALATIVEKSAACDFYAITYAEALKVTLDSATTTQAFENTVSSALPEFYAADFSTIVAKATSMLSMYSIELRATCHIYIRQYTLE